MPGKAEGGRPRHMPQRRVLWRLLKRTAPYCENLSNTALIKGCGL